MSYPTEALRGELTSGELKSIVAQLTAKLSIDISPEDLAGFQFESTDAVESEYIRLFDLPVDGPPCPLYGGLFGGDRRQVMEELLRLYRHFGLSTADAEIRDLPDSIPTVLEFLQFLTHQEESTGDISEAESFRTAQRDLLERHLTRWLPGMVAQVEPRNPTPLYLVTMKLTVEFTSRELQRLT
jgi:DMSO reductase family type II enzyme chaperone